MNYGNSSPFRRVIPACVNGREASSAARSGNSFSRAIQVRALGISVISPILVGSAHCYLPVLQYVSIHNGPMARGQFFRAKMARGVMYAV